MTIEQVYLSHDLISEETDTITTDHVYLERGLVAKTIEANTYYYFTDALGSVRQIWQYGSSNSAKFSVQTYRPFGTPVGVGGTDQKWKYAGEMLDSATGLYYIGARYMDPELGRWLSLDPELGRLSAPQTMNRYVYCVNNPLRFVDPTGEGFWSKLAKGVGDWWDKHKTEILGALVLVACVAAVIFLPGAGAFVATVALTSLESGLRTLAHGGSLQDIGVSMAIGAGVGALSFAGGAAIGKIASKVGGALLKTEIGTAIKGVGGKMLSSLGPKSSALWSKLSTPIWTKRSTGVGIQDLWETMGTGGWYKRGVQIGFPEVLEKGPTRLDQLAGGLGAEPLRKAIGGMIGIPGVVPQYQS